MISKELLSEVLGFKVNTKDRFKGWLINDSILEDSEAIRFKTNFESENDDGEEYIGERYNSINIHELAHKCKEWAYDEKELMVRTNAENTINGKACRVSMAKKCKFNDKGNWFYSTCANTEPEAIFKACEWILENNKG